MFSGLLMGFAELFTTTNIIELNAIKNINVLTIIDIFFKNNPSFTNLFTYRYTFSSTNLISFILIIDQPKTAPASEISLRRGLDL